MQTQKLIKGVATSATLGVILFNSIMPSFALSGLTATQAQERQQYRQQVCADLQTTIQDRIKTKQDVANQLKLRYDNLNTKLTNIETTVGSKFPSIDLTSLKADITKLADLYQTASAQSTAAQTAFANVDFTKCLSGTGEFKTQLQAARLASKQAYDAHQAYWTFVKTTVKTDLQSIKTQIQALKTV